MAFGSGEEEEEDVDQVPFEVVVVFSVFLFLRGPLSRGLCKLYYAILCNTILYYLHIGALEEQLRCPHHAPRACAHAVPFCCALRRSTAGCTGSLSCVPALHRP